MVGGLNGARPRLPQRRLSIVLSPRPGVPEPQRRQQPKPGRFRPAIVNGDADEHVFRAFLGVLHEHVKVPVVVKHARIEQFVLELLPRPSPVRLDQVAVGKLPLRVLVQILHVGVRGSAVDVEVVLLHVLPMVRLAVGEPEQALLQDRVALVPQREGKAQPLLVIADPPQPVLAPPVGPGARLVMGEIIPGVAVLAVVLADRAPLPLAEVGSPFLPRDSRLARVIQPLLFRDVDDFLLCHGSSSLRLTLRAFPLLPIRPIRCIGRHFFLIGLQGPAPRCRRGNTHEIWRDHIIGLGPIIKAQGDGRQLDLRPVCVDAAGTGSKVWSPA